MKTLKLVIFCLTMTFVIVLSWMVGSLIGNAITQTSPPPSDSANAGLAFLGVCVFNAILLTLLIGATAAYHGSRRRTALVLYVFAIQFLLPQMDTFFFASGIGIGYAQATAIVIAGAVVSFLTVTMGILMFKKMIGVPSVPKPLVIPYHNKKQMLLLVAVLAVIGYPFLYFTFGYYVAWQSETLRMFYTSSAATSSYLGGIEDAFGNGLYFFQVLRAVIWIAATVSIVGMLKERPVAQFLIVGVFSALLPTCLLFIPNPYMPWDISMIHFVETSTSNFLWGLLMVWAIRKF
ncbi:MAG TPA: hypothetical protein VK508_19730 [Cyclobacteriaceae bacterium]|nr:hypothetical protein [Cyclobacteriaceae bacterium]